MLSCAYAYVSTGMLPEYRPCGVVTTRLGDIRLYSRVGCPGLKAGVPQDSESTDQRLRWFFWFLFFKQEARSTDFSQLPSLLGRNCTGVRGIDGARLYDGRSRSRRSDASTPRAPHSILAHPYFSTLASYGAHFPRGDPCLQVILDYHAFYGTKLLTRSIGIVLSPSATEKRGT